MLNWDQWSKSKAAVKYTVFTWLCKCVLVYLYAESPAECEQTHSTVLYSLSCSLDYNYLGQRSTNTSCDLSQLIGLVFALNTFTYMAKYSFVSQECNCIKKVSQSSAW